MDYNSGYEDKPRTGENHVTEQDKVRDASIAGEVTNALHKAASQTSVTMANSAHEQCQTTASANSQTVIESKKSPSQLEGVPPKLKVAS